VNISANTTVMGRRTTARLEGGGQPLWRALHPGEGGRVGEDITVSMATLLLYCQYDPPLDISTHLRLLPTTLGLAGIVAVNECIAVLQSLHNHQARTQIISHCFCCWGALRAPWRHPDWVWASEAAQGGSRASFSAQLSSCCLQFNGGVADTVLIDDCKCDCAPAALPLDSAGAQALVAWVLQQVDPSSKLSMVAEEDAADLV